MRKRQPPASLSNEQVAEIITHLSNEQVAEIIIQDPMRYPGLMQIWAQMILHPYTPKAGTE